MSNIKKAARRAVKWLEANPDNHIIGVCAVNADREPVAVDSEEAVCFCAIGRLARELGLADMRESYKPLSDIITGDMVDNIWLRNDSSKADGIRALKELAR